MTSPHTHPLATKLTPTQRRLAAAEVVYSKWMDARNAWYLEQTGNDLNEDRLNFPAWGRGSSERGREIQRAIAAWFASHRDEIAAEILQLATLGRTVRWQDGVMNWARFMSNESPDHLEWGFTQYWIFAGHVA